MFTARTTGLINNAARKASISCHFSHFDAPLIGKQSTEAELDGDTFTTEGTFKLKLLGKVQYSLRGEVVGDNLTIYIDSSKGHYELVGVRA